MNYTIELHSVLNNWLLGYSHSDNNLVELGNGTTKEDDRAVLLEGGLAKSASAKFHSSSIKTNLIRCLLFYAVFSWSSPFIRSFTYYIASEPVLGF